MLRLLCDLFLVDFLLLYLLYFVHQLDLFLVDVENLIGGQLIFRCYLGLDLFD